ncbi:hypothetical protein BOTBODRAFT_324901 [Botryobasidium botryosum FD-172 SS1]|uniref:F-box domain-containing protein n=1 Tax=Botryobasidium botryosum (strain FD-172 SS1) TaxID=930990 RepID=A0A067NB38_BOTB1|nr:hypothetical protein BOTBODRAFT_324901 [Botryobasidium botryosum FD-172 SS1]
MVNSSEQPPYIPLRSMPSTESQPSVKAALVDDIQRIIFSYLQTSDLLTLALCSEKFNMLATPYLYRSVYLLLHVYGRPKSLSEEDCNIFDVCARQDLFRRTIMDRPHLARLVREIRWTVFATGVCEPAEYWSLFEPFKLVQRVYLDFDYEGLRNSPQPSPAGLFPRATHIALSRNWSLETALNLLHTPSRMIHLTLIYGSIQIPGVLTALAGECTNLRQLYLSKPSRISEDEPYSNDENDTAVILEWRSFLGASKSTLHEVGLALTAVSHGCMEYFTSPDVRDLIFAKEFIPVFVGGGWDNLESLVLGGVGNDEKQKENLEASVPVAQLSFRSGRGWSLEAIYEAYPIALERSRVWDIRVSLGS